MIFLIRQEEEVRWIEPSDTDFLSIFMYNIYVHYKNTTFDAYGIYNFYFC